LGWLDGFQSDSAQQNNEILGVREVGEVREVLGVGEVREVLGVREVREVQGFARFARFRGSRGSRAKEILLSGILKSGGPREPLNLS
jgi:hypothetical protein